MLQRLALKEQHSEAPAPVSLFKQDKLLFGRFDLRVGERRLMFDGEVVGLGDRAFDILAELVRNAGQVVSKRALCEAAWPDMIVEEGCLRFHVGVLRKVLGALDGSDRLLKTVAGRGYCFTGVASGAKREMTYELVYPSRAALPALRPMIARNEALLNVTARLKSDRFLTLVGPPGIGKTTLATHVAAANSSSFPDGTVFVDLSAAGGCAEVSGCVADALGLLAGPRSLDSIGESLCDQRALLVLDGCEHVIDAAAALADDLFKKLPKLAILATSREALRVEDEHVHRVLPLACPSQTLGMTADHALQFSAVTLFVERVQANQHGYRLSDADAPFVADICRKLDGIPLALELAAGRVPSYGIQQTAALIGTHLGLLWKGRRTAPTRHQTLGAALDWSYDLLEPAEQGLLQRMATLPAPSTLDEICTFCDLEIEVAAQLLAGLVGKSLVVVDDGMGLARYRLLDTMRVYALQKAKASRENLD